MALVQERPILKRYVSDMDGASVYDEVRVRNMRHIETLFNNTIDAEEWHNFDSNSSHVRRSDFEMFRDRFCQPSHLVDRAYRDTAHLLTTVISKSLPYVPIDATPHELFVMETMCLVSPISSRLCWPARLQNMIERCGFLYILAEQCRDQLFAAIADGSISSVHFEPGKYYRLGERIEANETSVAERSPFVKVIEDLALKFVRTRFGPFKIALLMGWWPYSCYDEMMLFGTLMNGIVHLATTGLLQAALERNPIVQRLMNLGETYSWALGGCDAPRLSAFQCLLTRPATDLFVASPGLCPLLLPGTRCAIWTACAPLSVPYAPLPYGTALCQIGAGSYAVVVKYRLPTGTDAAGRNEYAVKFQAETLAHETKVLADGCDSTAMTDLHVSKIITDHLSPFDGWMRPSDGTLHAANFVRLVDWQRFVGALSRTGVEVPPQFHPDKERLWQASVYEYAPGVTLDRCSSWHARSASLSSVILQWLAAMRTMSVACRFSHWDPGRRNCVYGPLKSYAECLADCTVLAYRAPVGCRSGDLAVRSKDTDGNIIRIIDHSLSCATSREHGCFEGLITGLCLTGTYCPRMDLHLFACSLLISLCPTMLATLDGPDHGRYLRLGVVSSKLLRLLDAMILPNQAVENLVAQVSHPDEELSYASYCMVEGQNVTRRGTRRELTASFCSSLGHLHACLRHLADVIDSYRSDQNKPLNWPRNILYMKELYDAVEDCYYLPYRVVVSLGADPVDGDPFDRILSMSYFDRYRVLASETLVPMSTERIVYMNENVKE